MKKLIEQYGGYFEPIIIGIALIFAMLGPRYLNLFYYWITFSLLTTVALWRLRFPQLYFRVIQDKAFLAYSLFILWGILSTTYWSEVKVSSTITVFTFLVGLLSYFIAYTDDRTTSINVQKIFFLIGIGLVFFTYFQFFTLGMKRPIGLLLNWNTHAALLGMIIMPWVLRYALILKTNVLQVFFVCLASALFAFAMGLTQSRGALLIIATGFVFLIIFIRQQRLSYKLGLVLLLSIVLGYLLSSFFVDESIMQRISTVADSQTYTARGYGRHLLWPAAWQMYLDRPYLGWGLESFSALFAQYKSPLHAEYGYYAHNDYLQFLLELGPIGLLLFLAFVFFIVRKLFFILQNKKCGLSENSLNAFVLLVSCLGMLIHSFFTFHLYQMSMQVILGYYLGGASKDVHFLQGLQSGGTEVKDNIHFKRFYRIIFFVMTLLVFITGFSSFYINKAEKTKDFQQKINYFLTAGLFFPALDKHDSLSARYYTDLLINISNDRVNEDKRKQIASYALHAVNNAIEKMPLQKWNYKTKAELLQNLRVNEDLVSLQYEKALEVDPYFLETRFGYAKFLEDKGHNNKAIDVMWAGWGLLNKSQYQKGLDYLVFQSELNDKYGDAKRGEIIEQQMIRIKELMELNTGGKFVFLKPEKASI